MSLWRTFHAELTDRSARLHELMLEAEKEGLVDGQSRQMARLLHTIKSAAMVVPVDPVTRCTHLAESVLQRWQTGQSADPCAALHGYVQWIFSLLTAGDRIDEVLSGAEEVASRLEGPLAS